MDRGDFMWITKILCEYGDYVDCVTSKASNLLLLRGNRVLLARNLQLKLPGDRDHHYTSLLS